MRSLKCKGIPSYKQRRNFFFLRTPQWHGLIFFEMICFSLDLKMLKKSANLAPNFSERKDINFCCVQMIFKHFDS